MTPLFIPLKAAYYEDFRRRTKRIEFRPYGPRWNERTCRIGRDVVLSKGYGKASRMTGRVVGFTKSTEPSASEAWIDCYGPGERMVACIEIEVDSAQGAAR